ncbi:uncharacterized protein LOC113071005 [Carassius auratus]|uniref:Uncharacterized protein LOC113071005 n=1 Tax=Carassius auratus TaxID=7957 RepID=A0A6P6MVU4_CARAU|nr:uncharacterized protein LOC113071005 [Carassius auratus]
MPQAAGSYGFIYPGCTAGTPENESVHEMGFVTTFQPDTRSLPLCNGDPRLLGSLVSWKSAEFYAQGTLLGTVMMQKVVTTDASLTGWGATQEGRTVNGLWPSRLRSAHKLFRAYGVWKALNHFLPCLQGHHVLVRCNNTTTVAYINRQGSVLSSKLHALAYKVLVWSGWVFVTRDSCSGPSKQRCGSSIKGKPNLRRLAPSPADSGYVMDEIWTGNRRSIRLARKLPLSYVLLAKGRGCTPRGRCTGPPMAKSAAVCLSSPVPDNSYTGQGERAGPVSHSDSTQVAQSTMAGAPPRTDVLT